MNVMSKRRQVVGTIAIALVLGLAATAASAPSGPPIRIGGTLALTMPALVFDALASVASPPKTIQDAGDRMKMYTLSTAPSEDHWTVSRPVGMNSPSGATPACPPSSREMK